MYRTSEETQKRKDARRQMILTTAAKVFAEKGYHNTAVKDIVEEAAISVGSFYFYFKGKEDLFSELYVSINNQFMDLEKIVLDTENFSLAKNFTRILTATLWMYEQNYIMAKLMLLEAVGLNPEFEKKRADSIKESCMSMEKRLERFKQMGLISIPDVKAASLIFEGSQYYLVLDWLQSENAQPLTDSACTLVTYTLQALRIDFKNEEIDAYIKEVLEELQNRKELIL